MSDKSSGWQQKARTEMQAEWQALQRLRERAAGGNAADEDCNILNHTLREYAALEVRLSKMEGLREACAEADQLLDAMATDGIKRWLVPAVRPLYAEVHTQLRAALAEEA